MAEHEKRFVWVKDKAGNEFVCRVEDLKDPKKVDDADLKNCLVIVTNKLLKICKAAN